MFYHAVRLNNMIIKCRATNFTVISVELDVFPETNHILGTHLMQVEHQEVSGTSVEVLSIVN